MLQVNGSVTAEPLDERGPLLGSPEQVAADLDQAAELGVDHVYWNTGADPLRTASPAGTAARSLTDGPLRALLSDIDGSGVGG